MTSDSSRLALVAGSLSLAGAAFLRRGYRNASTVLVERVTLRPAGLPAALAGLRLILLSDLHLPGIEHARGRLDRIVHSLEADAVLIAGDLVETQRGIPEAVDAVQHLAARWPTYVVFGSHDYYRPRLSLRHVPKTYFELDDGAQFQRELESWGAVVLHNQRLQVNFRNVPVDLLGLGDRYLGKDDLVAAVGDHPFERFVIVLSHSPDVLPEVARRGLPLLLAGHTHGGQIALPFAGAPFTHSTVYQRRCPAGVRIHGSTLAYVSRGFGTTTLPLRFNAPAEVSLITLLPQAGENPTI